MSKHEAGSAKWLNAQMKGRGLSKLKFYCQMCEKQCRDANGFKCHLTSDSHRRQMNVFLENPEKYVEEFSQQFEVQYMAALDGYSREGVEDPWLVANEVYSSIVRERDHVHMNATKWANLTDFLDHLEVKGVVRKRIDAIRKNGFEIQRIDLEKEKQVAQRRIDERKKREREQLREDRESEKRLKIMKETFTGDQATVSAPTGLERADPTERVQLRFGAAGGLVKPELSKFLSEEPDSIESLPQNRSMDAPSPQKAVERHAVCDYSDEWKGCVVKITRGPMEGKKGVVSKTFADRLQINILKCTEVADIALADIETVIPNINRTVRVLCGGPMKGKEGSLVAVDPDRGVASVYFSTTEESQDFRFDDISKFS